MRSSGPPVSIVEPERRSCGVEPPQYGKGECHSHCTHGQEQELGGGGDGRELGPAHWQLREQLCSPKTLQGRGAAPQAYTTGAESHCHNDSGQQGLSQ